jgi:hypothetical protein
MGARAQAWTRSRVRHQRLLQIGWRAGRAEREMGGGGGSVPRGGRKTGERGGPERGMAARTSGLGWIRAARSEAAASARGGGVLANRGGRRGGGDAVRFEYISNLNEFQLLQNLPNFD